jgi:hypothetical protein
LADLGLPTSFLLHSPDLAITQLVQFRFGLVRRFVIGGLDRLVPDSLNISASSFTDARSATFLTLTRAAGATVPVSL